MCGRPIKSHALGVSVTHLSTISLLNSKNFSHIIVKSFIESRAGGRKQWQCKAVKVLREPIQVLKNDRGNFFPCHYSLPSAVAVPVQNSWRRCWKGAAKTNHMHVTCYVHTYITEYIHTYIVK